MTAPLQYAFVGAFRPQAADGTYGGQQVACRTLIESGISKRVQWQCIDTTMRSLPPPPTWKRVTPALSRMARLARLCHRADLFGVLLFASAGASFVEKGTMAMMARRYSKRVVLAPRSGLLLDNIASSRAMRRFVAAVMRDCDAVLCQGTRWRERWQELTGLPEERLPVIPNWIDLSRFPEREPPAPTERPTFLYMGWLERYKGIYDLIDAAARSRDAGVPARYVICGRGSQEQEVRETVSRLDLESSFEFRGWVGGDEKEHILREATALVLPSHREGLPNVLLEAMATGLPVVATSVGGIPDVLLRDDLGILVPPGTPDALAQAMQRLGSDVELQRALAKSAREHVATHHDIERTWPRLYRVLAGE